MLILFHNFGIYVFLLFSFSNADSLLLVDCSFQSFFSCLGF